MVLSGFDTLELGLAVRPRPKTCLAKTRIGDPLSLYDHARNINSAVVNSNHAWSNSAFLNENSTMRATFASQLAYALGETPIQYATAVVNDAEGYIHVAVFAGNRIVWAANVHGGAEISTQVYSRANIEELEIISTPNALSSFDDSGTLQVRINLGGHDLVLPGDKTATPRNITQLEELLESLMQGFAPVK